MICAYYIFVMSSIVEAVLVVSVQLLHVSLKVLVVSYDVLLV